METQKYAFEHKLEEVVADKFLVRIEDKIEVGTKHDHIAPSEALESDHSTILLIGQTVVIVGVFSISSLPNRAKLKLHGSLFPIWQLCSPRDDGKPKRSRF